MVYPANSINFFHGSSWSADSSVFSATFLLWLTVLLAVEAKSDIDVKHGYPVIKRNKEGQKRKNTFRNIHVQLLTSWLSFQTSSGSIAGGAIQKSKLFKQFTLLGTARIGRKMELNFDWESQIDKEKLEVYYSDDRIWQGYSQRFFNYSWHKETCWWRAKHVS